MTLENFCRGIGLEKAAFEELKNLSVTEEEYSLYRKLYFEDREKFFSVLEGKENFRLLFLYCYCRLAAEDFEKYIEKNIPEQVYWDTFSDISIWCMNCFNQFGEYGLQEYRWLYRHIDLTLFRLGRLQFEKAESPKAIETENIKKGDRVINIHIPQGEKLGFEASKKSLKWAFEVFGKDVPYLCCSWLLCPDLKNVLDENSNILKFQSLFSIVETNYESREGEKRIFGNINDNACEYPENTSLQRNAKSYLISGGKFGDSLGIIKKDLF